MTARPLHIPAARRRGMWYRLPCGHDTCPIAPPEHLDGAQGVVKLPDVEGPEHLPRPIPSTGMRPAHIPHDEDGPSAGWGMIVRAYEGDAG